MKLFLSVLLLTTYSLFSQSDVVATFSINGHPTHGVKIKTNIPYGTAMPTVIIEGYAYGSSAKTIGLILNWYVYNGNFINHSITNFGAYKPKIDLYNENGKVSIFIDDKVYFQRFQVRAFGKGLSGDSSVNYQGWSVVDEAPSGTNQVTLPYKSSEETNITAQLFKTKNPNNSNAQAMFDWKDDTARVRVGGTGTGSGNGFEFRGVGDALMLKLSQNGNVGIGTDTPDAKLAVNGDIHTREIRIDLDGWADYVFEHDYKLKPLSDVENYIQENGHLEGIPSEKEMTQDGMKLKDITIKQQEKIEELTLYIIELNKRLDALEKKK